MQSLANIIAQLTRSAPTPTPQNNILAEAMSKLAQQQTGQVAPMPVKPVSAAKPKLASAFRAFEPFTSNSDSDKKSEQARKTAN